MKITVPLSAALLLGACSQEGVVLGGTLSEGWPQEPLEMMVEGEGSVSSVRGGEFRLDGLPAGPVRLRIRSGDEEVAHLEIGSLPAGAEVLLERIRRSPRSDLAFPATVRLKGADMALINGLRMADPDVLPTRVEGSGTILAMNDGADRLILRPSNERLPDLPVVVTPETRIEYTSGEPADLRSVEQGDPLLVEGRTDAGYLYARQIVLGSTWRGGATGPPREDREGAGENSREVESSETDTGRGIPEGHRPPPGECRDWDPNLPPGQQPPPRKC